MVTLLALFLFGGSVIHQFAGALLIGIVSGTYSSIFNASVLLVLWKQRDLGLATGGPTPRSGLAARPSNPAPGDRPLVTPRPSVGTATAAGPTAETNGSETETASRPGAARRQPTRRRRM